MPYVPPLIAGPYKTPRCRVGRELFDFLRGDLVVIRISEAPIPWPMGRSHHVCRPIPIMTEGLARAVRLESELAVMYYWGVSRWTVCRWRRALGVDRFNPGTRELWRELAKTKLTDEARLKSYAGRGKTVEAAQRRGPICPCHPRRLRYPGCVDL